jgi:hypothetical protein
MKFAFINTKQCMGSVVYVCASEAEFRVRRLLIVKAIPLQAWTGPEGSRRLRFPDFQTIGTSIGHVYPPGNIPGTH